MLTDNANPEGERCLIEPDLGKHLPLSHFVTLTVTVYKAVNREDKRSRRYRDRHFAKI